MVGLISSYLQAGLIDEALGVAVQPLARIEQTGACLSEAELYRLKGETLLRGVAPVEAEAQACFERTITIAREQSARPWDLRAATSLARLLDKRDKRDEARPMLAEIYNWFTEGFDTRDLIDAKSLLDELAE